MELELAASTVEVSATGLLVGWSDGGRSRFHALWLRDNCPTGGRKGSDQRTFSVVDLNPELFVLDAERNDEGDLLVEFSDGHESTFTFDWLRGHSHEPHDHTTRSAGGESFRAGSDLPRFDLPRSESPRHVEMIDAVDRTGVVLVDGVPPSTEGLAMVHELLGGTAIERPALGEDPRRDPGVRSLELHTAQAARAEPPAILVYIAADRPLEMTLVDGFAVADELHDLEPDAFDVLAHTSVPLIERDQDDGVRFLNHGPVISIDHHRNIAGIRFEEAAIGPLDIDPSGVGEFYRALITFVGWLRDPARGNQVSLASGQALVIDNRRVLCSGAPPSGAATVGRDSFIALGRRLRHQ